MNRHIDAKRIWASVPSWLVPGATVVLPTLDRFSWRLGHHYRVVFVKLSRQCHSGIVVGVQPLDQYEFKRPKEVDMGHCERVIQVEEQPAKPKLDISLPEESMTNHEKLMKELELMSALKDHTDPSDTNPLRVSLNKAWDVVRDRAAKAADDYVANPEG